MTYMTIEQFRQIHEDWKQSGLTFSFDDDTSDMVNVNEKNAEGEGIIYSLQGIRMKSSQAITKRGLYIKDGKKVVLNEAK